MEQYVRLSVDLHLFFSRIMKEHAIFMEVAFQRKAAFGGGESW